MYYVYVIQAQTDNNKFYLGSTTELRRRMEQHNQVKNESTKTHQWELVYYEAYVTESAAREREHKLKHDGRAKRNLMQRIKKSLTNQ